MGGEAPVPSIAALEAQLRRNLADPAMDWASWRVYGDWLLEQGDLRGELIAIEHRLAVSVGGELPAAEAAALRSRAHTLSREHEQEWLEGLAFPEVVEFYRMSGDVDYLLRVAVPDIAAYDVFYKKLISRVEIAKVSSAFAMEEIKHTTAMPLGFARMHADR